MKKILSTMFLGAILAVSASAAPLAFTTTFGGNAIILPTNVGASAVTFSTFQVANPLCSIACTAVTFNTGLTLSSGAGEQFTFDTANPDVVFTTNATPWTVQLGPGNTRVITLTGNFARGGDNLDGTLIFTWQASGTVVNGQEVSSFSVSGGTIPEPGTMALMGAGLVGLGFMARRRRA